MTGTVRSQTSNQNHPLWSITCFIDHFWVISSCCLHKPNLIQELQCPAFNFSELSILLCDPIFFFILNFLLTNSLKVFNLEERTLLVSLLEPIFDTNIAAGTTTDAWEIFLGENPFDPPGDGSTVMRCRSMTWARDTTSCESYNGLPKSHMANAFSSSCCWSSVLASNVLFIGI